MKVVTKNGYDFFEATSAFQKAIRRGDEDVALYFGVEFFNSGYEGYIWKRMKIIASEDVGLAAPDTPVIINALHKNFEDQAKDKKDSRPERLFLINAILLLVRCPKSRLVDWKSISLWREHELKKMPIPEYAYDMHNYTGKRQGKGIDHFYDDGCKLTNHAKIDGEKEAKEHARKLHKQQPGKLKFTIVKKATIPQQEFTFGEDA